MATKDPTKPQKPRQQHHNDPDPEHDFEWGGEMEQDDADVPHDGGQKGGRSHREGELPEKR